MESIVIRSRALIQGIRDGLNEDHKFGSMSASVYDTAWVSIVQTRPASQRPEWTFPECFLYVLQEQGPDGLWPKYHSATDCILNSLAALFALIVHREQNLQSGDTGKEIDHRIDKCVQALAQVLKKWDVSSCVHVGFEILVPNLLDRLVGYGILFDFPGQTLLSELHKRKLQKFRPEALYHSQQTTLLHSLEAFIGKIEFEKVTHHLTNGSFLGSPSSTAAYLLSVPHGHEQAEAFLRSALQSHGNGAVPSAYPSSIFETSWVLSTLLGVNFERRELGEANIQPIASWLEKQFDQQDGLLGFAPAYLPDADDTAKAITALHRLGVDAKCESMIQEFSQDTHFRTYRYESNASFSANCNVLMALLSAPSPNKYNAEIHTAIKFLCEQWFKGPIRDKWNLSSEYSSMLLAQVLATLVRCWSHDKLDDTFSSQISGHISVILFQILTQTLRAQNEDGSWSTSTEVTAYALIAIAQCMTLSWGERLHHEAVSSLARGQQYLDANSVRWRSSNHLWVEKVSYGSPILAETYCLAAMKACSDVASGVFEDGMRIHDFSSDQSKKLCKFFSKIPLLERLEFDGVTEAMTEATIYFKSLHQIRTEIFPRKDMAEDKYLQYIPFTWTACNRLNEHVLSNQTVWEMMVISMLNYQVDEYMEAVVSGLSDKDISMLEDMIRERCLGNARPTAQLPNPQGRKRKHAASSTELPPTPAEQRSPASHSLEEVVGVLGKYIDRIQIHPAVSKSSDSAKQLVGHELVTFLLAHIQHNRDNTRFMSEQHISAVAPSDSQSLLTYKHPGTSYFQWVRSTSADHTSCPYSFAFFCCLLSVDSARHCLTGTKQQYFGQALCRHLATMCRQYNDYGSLQRDQAELNLNSLNFPEFSQSDNESLLHNGHRHEVATGTITPPETAVKPERVTKAKNDLMEIAEYERTIVKSTMARLKGLISSETTNAFQTFIDVTDLYGQIYVARDIASRMR